MDIHEILSRCDHTLLRPDATLGEIIGLCGEGVKYGCASVCVPPSYVAAAFGHVNGGIPICTVIGFPNGYMSSGVKVFEAREAIAAGACELDMVINLGMVRDRRWRALEDEISALRDACAGKILKVIIEACMLNEDEKIRMCEIVSLSGADFIKTSTGFSHGGATREDIALLRRRCAPHVRIKASGGISSLLDARDFIALGADRLGTSRIVGLAAESGL